MTTKRITGLQIYRALYHLYSVATLAKVFHIHNFIRFSQRWGVGQTGIIIPILQMRTPRVREGYLIHLSKLDLETDVSG